MANGEKAGRQAMYHDEMTIGQACRGSGGGHVTARKGVGDVTSELSGGDLIIKVR